MDQADETAYAALAAAVDDARWAFGTGFTDPLAGVDPAVPEGLDRPALAAWCVMLADDALVHSHRLQEWVTRLPELEEEAAVANIALDLLGQARRLYARAGQAEGTGRGEDEWAFGRDEPAWRCVRLVEPPIDDFAALVLRVLVVAAWRRIVISGLETGADPVLAAIAGQAVKELAYHVEWAAGWVVRLGDGTPESHRRLQAAADRLWPFVAELFDPHEIEALLPDVVRVPSPAARPEFDRLVGPVLDAAGVDVTAGRIGPVAGGQGRDGRHTEWLSRLLAELQSVARSLPGAVW